MRWLSIATGVAIIAGLMAVPAMAAHHRVAVGRAVAAGPRAVIVRPYAPVIVRPYVVRPYPYFYYGPAWYGYNWGPGWYYPGPRAYNVAPATGQVKIETHLKGASVYVDGGYVGPIEKFKKFDLLPGNHDIEVRDASGQTIFKEAVQVILDRTVEIRLPT